MAERRIHSLFNARSLCHKPMTAMKFLFTSLALLSMAHVPHAEAQRHSRDADDAYRGRQTGALRPLREIEGGVVPQMKRRGADYIGAEYDGGAGRYRLKFMRDGSVIWVDVDGRTGAVVARAGD